MKTERTLNHTQENNKIQCRRGGVANPNRSKKPLSWDKKIFLGQLEGVQR